MLNTTAMIFVLASLFVVTTARAQQPAPVGPVPSANQLEWQKLELTAFIHFGPNTFSNAEWGKGTEKPDSFNPTQLDCRQWCRTFKQAGFKQIVITAKHHDGFCLFPSKFSNHTVAQSKWRDGKGDVLAELRQACNESGLKMGVYLSPWDRNHPAYGTPEYNQIFANTLAEVLQKYAPIYEVWFDGANGEGPNGKKQVYDWKLFHDTVRKYAPKAVIFSDGGPDIRWIGNESGIAGETNWSTINRARYLPGTPHYSELTSGDEKGTDWVPGECDVSIRPGWFWHENENGRVKTPAMLEDLYNASVGRNSQLLLNVPPDRRGLIHEQDAVNLIGFKKRLDSIYKKNLAAGATADSSSSMANYPAKNVLDGNPNTFWCASDRERGAILTVNLKKPTAIDRVVLQEAIQLGQRVKQFEVEGKVGNDWLVLSKGTTIGNKRILVFQAREVSAIRVNFLGSHGTPMISSLGLYATPSAALQAKWLHETESQKAQRMKWFRDARFGMFIHWGVYSEFAGEFNGKNVPGAGEWFWTNGQFSYDQYTPIINKFNPVNFNAKRWVEIAKNSGMKYIVITSKHHDGFNNWLTKLTNWNINNTPWKGRDPIKELAVECKKQGIVFCLYHSIMDWHHPDYLPRRSWMPRPEIADFDKFNTYLKAELKELLTRYGDLGILWFDGEWEETWTHELGKELYAFCRSLQPNLIVNNRVDTFRSGMMGLNSSDEAVGDYGTPEQEVPPQGLGDKAIWESCMTMNGTWGFHKYDHNWKSASQLIQILVDCASKGGNYLLNVGPTGLGEIPPESVERLAAVGKWMNANSEAVYGTKASPLPRPLTWGRITQKPGKMYFHWFPGQSNQLLVPGLNLHATRAYELADSSRSVRFASNDSGFTLMPIEANTSEVKVFVVEYSGTPVVKQVVPKQSKDGSYTFLARDAESTGSIKYEADKNCLGYWLQVDSSASWKFECTIAGTYELVIPVACPEGSAGGECQFDIAGQKENFKIPLTGAWSTFVPLKSKPFKLKTGLNTLTFRGIKKPGEALLNLGDVKLVKR